MESQLSAKPWRWLTQHDGGCADLLRELATKRGHAACSPACADARSKRLIAATMQRQCASASHSPALNSDCQGRRAALGEKNRTAARLADGMHRCTTSLFGSAATSRCTKSDGPFLGLLGQHLSIELTREDLQFADVSLSRQTIGPSLVRWRHARVEPLEHSRTSTGFLSQRSTIREPRYHCLDSSISL